MFSGDASPGARRHYSSETSGCRAHDGHDGARNALAHDCRHSLHASSPRFRDRGDYLQIFRNFNADQETNMPGKRRKSPPEHPIERLLRAVSTIGQLEIIAGIDRSPEGDDTRLADAISSNSAWYLRPLIAGRQKSLLGRLQTHQSARSQSRCRLSGTSPPSPTEGRAQAALFWLETNAALVNGTLTKSILPFSNCI
jgi:hypothetical protein